MNAHRYGTRRCLSALMRPGPLPPNEDGPGRWLLHRVPRPPKRASPSERTHTAHPCIHIRHTGPGSTRTSQTDYASNPRTATSRARTCASRSTARQFWNHRDAPPGSTSHWVKHRCKHPSSAGRATCLQAGSQGRAVVRPDGSMFLAACRLGLPHLAAAHSIGRDLAGPRHPITESRAHSR